jgi:hypothetical protein
MLVIFPRFAPQLCKTGRPELKAAKAFEVRCLRPTALGVWDRVVEIAVPPQ